AAANPRGGLPPRSRSVNSPRPPRIPMPRRMAAIVMTALPCWMRPGRARAGAARIEESGPRRRLRMPRVRDQSMEVKFEAGEASRPVAVGRAVDVLNSLLRGELAAIETYRQAIEKDGPDAASLASLRDEHADSATRLRERIVALSGTPDT